MDFEEKVYSFLKYLNQFQHHYDGDRVWSIICPDNKKWHKFSVRLYQDTYYIALIDDYDICSLEVKIGKSVSVCNTSFRPSFGHRGRENLDKIWASYIDSLQRWLKIVQRDWIKTSQIVMKNYPLNYRTGYVSHALIRTSLPDIYRLDLAIGKKNLNKLIKIIESNYLRDRRKTICSEMTAKRYFDYCKIAYIAAQGKNDTVDEKLSGKEMYERYADGRHEGLLDIDLDSMDEFSSWLDGSHPKREMGGHPWEIKRGGNTTHIDLYVSRPHFSDKKDFIVTVSASAITRLAEAIRMFLAIYDAGLPIQISDSDAILKRLLAQDNIGIIPKYDSLHRANQRFPKDQDVYDVMYFDSLGKYKRRIKDFIVWEPLPLLIPK